MGHELPFWFMVGLCWIIFIDSLILTSGLSRNVLRISMLKFEFIVVSSILG